MGESPEASAGRGARAEARRERLLSVWRSYEPHLFALWCVVVTTYAASLFYGAMRVQTGGAWSLPLDDAFIHFDFARTAARGRPLWWSPDSGYSSGNTSVLYPLVLALGWLLGFRELRLVPFAAALACLSLVGFFVASARLTWPLGSWVKFLLPPAVLSIGVLSWSLFSGMEVAFLLALWGVSLVAWDRARLRLARGEGGRSARWLGLSMMALVLTRPEAVVCVAAFACTCALAARGRRARLAVLGWSALPSALALVWFGVMNRVLTGEWAQAGAVAKLALYDPYLGADGVAGAWAGNLRYVVTRSAHHLSEQLAWSWLVPLVAALPLLSRSARGPALLLWAQVLGWALLVSLNDHVRYQNERYLMPAFAWLALLAVMGVGVLLRELGHTREAQLRWGLRASLAALAMGAFWWGQRGRFWDQVWFFARASRNIHDQQLEVGRRLQEKKPARVLVGDAGAIMYLSDRPGLDLIGLGGYRGLPFARAYRHGVGASLELVERIPENDRPDVMAIYPEWWGDLGDVFGHPFERVTAHGNVICGAATKVLYEADWGALERASSPRALGDAERVHAELDVADLVSERAAGYPVRGERLGRTTWAVRRDPQQKNRDLFDAGRNVAAGQREVFELSPPSGSIALVLRTFVREPTDVSVVVDGAALGTLRATPGDSWVEPRIELSGTGREMRFELSSDRDWASYHIWIVGPDRE